MNGTDRKINNDSSPDFPPGVLGPVPCGLAPPETPPSTSAAVASAMASPFTACLGAEPDVGEEEEEVVVDINLATSLMKELFGPAAVAASLLNTQKRIGCLLHDTRALDVDEVTNPRDEIAIFEGGKHMFRTVDAMPVGKRAGMTPTSLN